MKSYLVGLRREFHEYPEASKKEYKTSARIAEELKLLGIEYEVIGKTNIVGVINKENSKKTIALRADIDAIEIFEETGLEFSSKNEGIMHACGHDGHISMLLGAAKVLNENKEKLNGCVKLFFQSAEEIFEGAKEMIDHNVLEGVDRFFGMHLWATLESGKISVEAGPRMAASGIFDMTITGKGGHGAMPHQSIDPITTSASIIQNLQHIISREINPLCANVITIGEIHSGTRFNIIPETVKLKGTIRTFNKEMLEILPQKISKVSKATAEGFGCSVDFNHKWLCTVTNSDEIVSNEIEKIVLNKFQGQLVKLERTTGGEDASLFLDKVPGVYAYVGAKINDYPHHNSKFDINEESLEVGMKLYVEVAMDYLK